jgi:hypothetical protein
VLYDLTFLEKKNYWPVPEESGRMRRYASNELLYKARHDAVFGNWWKLHDPFRKMHTCGLDEEFV